MAYEIERRFLVNTSLWVPPALPPAEIIVQGYLCASEDGCAVRVRSISISGGGNQKAFLTVKTKKTNYSCCEFEYEIPVNDARFLTSNCENTLVNKIRYTQEEYGKTWVVDVFYGDNLGLVIAEIELESEEETFEKPHWLLEEVTHDRRYANAALSKKPFLKWEK